MITCNECKFFKPPKQKGMLGECRYAPPLAETETWQGFWPFIEETEWCGKAEPDVKSE